MREYVVTDLVAQETAALEQALQERGCQAGLEHLYWIELPATLRSAMQREHAACGPHVAALEVTETSVRLELLVRAKNKLRCECIAYATAEQMAWLVGELHGLLHELGIEC